MHFVKYRKLDERKKDPKVKINVSSFFRDVSRGIIFNDGDNYWLLMLQIILIIVIQLYINAYIILRIDIYQYAYSLISFFPLSLYLIIIVSDFLLFFFLLSFNTLFKIQLLTQDLLFNLFQYDFVSF